MGITGLLPLLKSVTRRVHLRDFAGLAVAVDTYSWLHKGMYGDGAYNQFYNIDSTEEYVTYCMARIKLLRAFKITPILVFDGATLPAKAHRDMQRAR